jgi:hypothetical protein
MSTTPPKVAFEGGNVSSGAKGNFISVPHLYAARVTDEENESFDEEEPGQYSYQTQNPQNKELSFKDIVIALNNESLAGFSSRIDNIETRGDFSIHPQEKIIGSMHSGTWSIRVLRC